MHLKYPLIVAIAFLIVLSCTKDKGRLPVDALPVSTSAIDTCSANVSYSLHIAPILSNVCGVPNCHGAGGGPGSPDFQSYTKIQTEINNFGAANFIKRISGSTADMPPSYTTGPQLSSCESKKLVAWINDGYKSN